MGTRAPPTGKKGCGLEQIPPLSTKDNNVWSYAMLPHMTSRKVQGQLFLHLLLHMKFGLDKCAKTLLKKENDVHSQNLILDINRETQQLEQGKLTSKYLGNEGSEVYSINTRNAD